MSRDDFFGLTFIRRCHLPKCYGKPMEARVLNILSSLHVLSSELLLWLSRWIYRMNTAGVVDPQAVATTQFGHVITIERPGDGAVDPQPVGIGRAVDQHRSRLMKPNLRVARCHPAG